MCKMVSNTKPEPCGCLFLVWKSEYRMYRCKNCGKLCREAIARRRIGVTLHHPDPPDKLPHTPPIRRREAVLATRLKRKKDHNDGDVDVGSTTG